MITFIQKNLIHALISATILIGLGFLIYNGNNTNRCEAQSAVWAQATQLIQERMHTTLSIKNPVMLIAALSIEFSENPNDTAKLSEIIKCWANQGGNINQLFKAGDAYPLFFTTKAFNQIDQELKDQPTTVLVAFAGLSTIVATLLQHGALPVVEHANALNAWADQYEQVMQDDPETSNNSQDFMQMLHNALRLLLRASTPEQQHNFFEKYPQFKEFQAN